MTDLLTRAELDRAMATLDGGWAVSGDGRVLSRRVEVKGFMPAMDLAQKVAHLAEDLNHHPDISLGWGYCEIRWTSHDAGGLTRRDVTAAARVDDLLRR